MCILFLWPLFDTKTKTYCQIKCTSVLYFPEEELMSFVHAVLSLVDVMLVMIPTNASRTSGKICGGGSTIMPVGNAGRGLNIRLGCDEILQECLFFNSTFLTCSSRRKSI